MKRGIKEEEEIEIIVNGLVKEVIKELKMELEVEEKKMIGIQIEGRVG